jgi:hypothetical protein
MVHGNNDRTPGFPVHDAFHADKFADHFSSFPRLDLKSRTTTAIKKAVVASPAPRLLKVFLNGFKFF